MTTLVTNATGYKVKFGQSIMCTYARLDNYNDFASFGT